MIFGLKNNKEFVNFYASSRKSKFALWSDPFAQSFRWKNTEDLCFMTLKIDGKFEVKLPLGSKSDMKNLASFHPTTEKSENFTSMGYFSPKYVRFELKKYRGVICYDIEQWRKNWLNPNLEVSKMA